MQLAACLNRTENPQNQGLDDNERGRANAEGQVDAQELANVDIGPRLLIPIGPTLEPDISSCKARLAIMLKAAERISAEMK